MFNVKQGGKEFKEVIYRRVEPDFGLEEGYGCPEPRRSRRVGVAGVEDDEKSAE